MAVYTRVRFVVISLLFGTRCAAGAAHTDCGDGFKVEDRKRDRAVRCLAYAYRVDAGEANRTQ